MVTKKPKNTPASAPASTPEADPLEAMVIAELVKNGVPYAQAVAQVRGGGAPVPPQPASDKTSHKPSPDEIRREVEREDEQDKVQKPKKAEMSSKQYDLVELLKNIDEHSHYPVSFEVPAYLMDWLIRVTLAEAYYRGRPDFGIEQFLVQLLKEQRAIDPTKGGTVKGGSSGPKDLYNPATGQWDKTN